MPALPYPIKYGNCRRHRADDDVMSLRAVWDIWIRNDGGIVTGARGCVVMSISSVGCVCWVRVPMECINMDYPVVIGSVLIMGHCIALGIRWDIEAAL